MWTASLDVDDDVMFEFHAHGDICETYVPLEWLVDHVASQNMFEILKSPSYSSS